jgi:hypothetical protein
MTESETLPKKVERAFPHGPPPREEDIALHQCLECDRLRKDFVEYDASSLPDEVVDANFDKLPLLSPIAMRAYLGSYLKRGIAIADFGHLVCEFLLYGFSPKREDWKNYFPDYSLLDDRQIQVIVEFFEFSKRFKDAEWHGKEFKRLDEFIQALLLEPRPSLSRKEQSKR